MNKVPEISASELVLSAIFFLQQKNGVTAAEITKFICDKRKCKAKQVKAQVMKALNRAIKNGIFSRKRGLYRIEKGFGKKLNAVKARERRLLNGKNKAKHKAPNNVLPSMKMAVKEPDYKGGTNPLDSKVFHATVSEDNAFQYSRADVYNGKMERARNDDISNSSESRSEQLSLRSIQRGVAMDNEDYEDDDDSEDDDDDVDYFTEDHNSDNENIYNAADSKMKSAAKERNDSSGSESPDRSQKKKRRCTTFTDKSNKRTRKASTDESNDDEKKNNRREEKIKRVKKAEKKRNKKTHKTKPGHKNKEKYEFYFSDNNDTGDSDDEKILPDKKQSDYSSDSDNISIKSKQTNRDNNQNLKKSGNVQDERQQKEHDKTKEPSEAFKEDQVQQKKNKHKEDIPLDKQKPLQNTPADKSKDSPNANHTGQKTNGTGKQTLSGSRPSSSAAAHAQPDIFPVHGSDSRSPQRQTNAKLLRCARKRIAGSGKKTSKHKSTKRRHN